MKRPTPVPSAAPALRHCRALGLLLPLLALPALAQTVLQHPDVRLQETQPAALPPPAGTKAVRAANGWVLVAPEGTASAAADQPPAVSADRFRRVAAPGGVVLVDDALAASTAAAPASPAFRAIERVNPATGQRLLEMPGLATDKPGPEPKGLREVELRTPEEVARAMLQPEPLVRYRVGTPAVSRPDRPTLPRVDPRSGR